jgi:NADH-quinone oxidoreductase subunit M
MLSDRRHTRLIAAYGGIKRVVPQLTAASLVITLASIGLPGLNGFVGEFLVMLGAFQWDGRFVYAGAIGVVLSAAYMLWMFQRVYYGEVTDEHNRELPDLSPREWAILGPLCALAIAMGVVPNVLLRPMEPAVNRIVERLERFEPLAERAPAAPAPAAPVALLSGVGGHDDHGGASVGPAAPGDAVPAAADDARWQVSAPTPARRAARGADFAAPISAPHGASTPHVSR